MEEVDLPSAFLINRYIYFEVYKIFILLNFAQFWRGIWRRLTLGLLWTFLANFGFLWVQKGCFVEILTSAGDKNLVVWVDNPFTFLLMGITGLNLKESRIRWVITQLQLIILLLLIRLFKPARKPFIRRNMQKLNLIIVQNRRILHLLKC